MEQQRSPRRPVIRALALILACAAATAVAVSALAQEGAPPASAPAAERVRPDPQEPASDGREDRGSDGNRERGDGAEANAAVDSPPPAFEVSGDEWNKAMEFMKEQAPKRTALLADIPEDFQTRLRERFAMHYRQLQRLKNSDPAMYEIQVRRINAEDEVQATRHLVRWRNHTLSPEELSKLREKVTVLADVVLEERELRVQRLRDIVRREEQVLTREKSQREPLIEETMSAVEAGHGGGLIGGFGGRGGFGGPGGAGGPPSGGNPPPPGRGRP